MKVILVVGDEGAKNPAPAKIYNIDDDEDDEYDFGRMMNPRGPSSKNEKDELCDFAKHTLKQICSQEWVHNRCLQVLKKDLFFLILFDFFLIFLF